MSEFTKWYEEADMPMKDEDGKWYDAETGIAFTRSTATTKRRSLSNKALAAREVAKLFGGYALQGSKKQKEWGESIRADKLQQLGEEYLEEAFLLCDKHGLGRHAHFWIANRDKPANEFVQFIIRQKALLKACNKAKAENQTEEAKKMAEEYNALTKLWGFD